MEYLPGFLSGGAARGIRLGASDDRAIKARRQAVVQGALLIAPLAVLPISAEATGHAG